jgi:hypothetical protein
MNATPQRNWQIRFIHGDSVPEVSPKGLATLSRFNDLVQMERGMEKRTLLQKLARCRQLSREFPNGVTAQNLRDLEADLQAELRLLEKD